MRIFAVVFLSWVFSPSKDEVVRAVSPSGTVDAVLLETNAGATTSFGYEIYILEHGAQPSGSPAVFLYGATRISGTRRSMLRVEISFFPSS